MTKENAKRLYDHYVEEGMKEEAENIAKRHPEFLGTQTTAETVDTEETKSEEKKDAKKPKGK